MPGPLLNTPILDLFQRANVGPPPGSDWLTGIRSGDSGFKVVNNQAVPNAAYSSVYWPLNFARRQEIFVKIAALPTPDRFFELWINITNPGTGSLNGYMMRFWRYPEGTNNGNLDVFRVDAGGGTLLTWGGATITPGDVIAFANDNGILRLYKNDVEVSSWADSTYTNAGFIGFRADNDTSLQLAFDEVGGGDGSTFKQFFGFQPATQSLPYTAEGGSWAFNAGGGSTIAGTLDTAAGYESSNDPGAGTGGLRARRTGKNVNNGTPYWEWTGTWEDLGIPAGSVITQVSLDHDWAQPEYTTGAAGVIGPSELRDNAGALQATIQASGATPAAAQAAWTKRTGTAQAVPSALQPSNSTIKLRIGVIPKTGNSTSAAVSIGVDLVAVTVTYSYTPGGALDQPIEDTLSLSDAQVFGQGKVITETFILSDDRSFDQGKVLTDTLALTDARAFEQEKIIADILALADNQLFEKGQSILLADILTLADAQLLETGKGVSLADALTLSDGLIFEQAKLITDSLVLADVQAFTFGLSKVLADTLTLSDALALGRGMAIADILPLADSVSTNRGLLKDLSDILTLSDLSVQDTGKGVTIADTLLLADSLAFTRPLAIADTLALADALAFERSVYLSLSDTVPLVDTYIFTHGRMLADILPLTDTHIFAHGRTLADTLSLVDAANLSLGKQLTLVDALALVDAANLSLGKQLMLVDTLTLTDIEALTFTRGLVLADALMLADAAGLSLGRELTLVDILTLVDAILTVKRVAGVVLNEATALYLGEQDILAAYLGDELVWPPQKLKGE